jgi:EmrB/QacA subfamily drug resistance transporter
MTSQQGRLGNEHWPPVPPAAAEPSGGHGWRAVAVVLVGAFMALLDTTIVTVALPTIRSGLHASPATLEWVVSAYALAYGLTLVPAGRAGDRFGHKPLFLIGLTVFTLASLACGLSQSQGEIIVARAVQGIGAGIFYPAISATIQLSFTGAQRSKAFGALGSTIGASIALGPVLGGLIIAGAGAGDGWRWVFLVNLLIGAVAVPVAAWLLPSGQSRVPRQFDLAGVGLLSAGLLLLLIPLVEGQQENWPPWCYACLGGCAVVFALLAWWEIRADRAGRDPLLAPSLLAQPSFSAGAVFAVVYFAGFTSVFFTISILWQSGLARSALMTGLVAVPFSFGSLSAAVSGKLSALMGRMVLITGCAMVGTGLALTALVVHLAAPAPGGWELVGPLLLAGLGNGIVVAPNQDFVLARVPSQDAGTAGAILGTAQRVGSAVGVAVIGTVLFGSLHVHPGPDAVAVAFSHAAQVALLANVGFVVVALILVLALPRQTPSRER